MKETKEYLTLSRRLDEIVAAIQAPDITIDQATAYYEEGSKLIKELEAYLKTAENHIQKLTTQAED
jgi:exodeoxyribonuclease VII small subunit